MLIEKCFEYVLRDFRSYLSNLENLYESELFQLSYDDFDNLDYLHKCESNLHEIYIVKSWLTDYEYKLGIKK